MRDVLDQLLFDVKREMRRAKHKERLERKRHKIPLPEAQGKPERWHAVRCISLVHESGERVGIFTELHHELHPEWRRLQTAPEGSIPTSEEIVSGLHWFSAEPVEFAESELETIALRERFLELLNAAEAEHYSFNPADNGDSGGSEDQAGLVSLLASRG